MLYLLQMHCSQNCKIRRDSETAENHDSTRLYNSDIYEHSAIALEESQGCKFYDFLTRVAKVHPVV